MPPFRRKGGTGPAEPAAPGESRLQSLPPHLKTLIANFCNRQGVANACAAGVTDFKQQFQSILLDINDLRTKYINMLNAKNTRNNIVFSKDFFSNISTAFHQLSYTIYHTIKKELDTFAEIRQMPPDEQGREFVKAMWEKHEFISNGPEDFKYSSLNDFIDYQYEDMDMETQTNTIATVKVTIAAYWRHYKTQFPNAKISGEAYKMLKVFLEIRGTTITFNGENADERYTVVPATEDPAIVAEIAEFLGTLQDVQKGGRRRVKKNTRGM